MATKGDIVNGAYARLRISGLTVKSSPEEMTAALDVLEDMCAEFEERNICLNYNFQDSPDPSDDTNVARGQVGSLKDILAWRMAMFFGKVIPPSMEAMQRKAISLLQSSTAKVNRVNHPTRMPIGSGTNNRVGSWQRFNIPQSQAPISCSTKSITLGGVLDFTEDLNHFLGGETIDTYSLNPSPALTIESNSEDEGVISYRVKCGDNASDLETIDIIVITNNGRRATFLVNFKCVVSKIAVQ